VSNIHEFIAVGSNGSKSVRDMSLYWLCHPLQISQLHQKTS